MKRKSGSLIPAEELDATLDELLALAATRGEYLRSIPNRVSTSTPSKPDITGLLKDKLRASLEKELVPAPRARDGEIDSAEIEHELVKKALIGLKLSALRDLAKESGVASSGVAEDVASRVASAYGWDSDQVARLVIAHEDEPTPERGHVSRLFPLRDGVDTAEILDRLRIVTGRYVRVGVARWFVFDSLTELDEDVIDVVGTYRAYRAAIDEVEGTASLRALPDKQQVLIRVRRGSVLEVRGASTQGARAAARAFEIAAGVDLRGNVPFADIRVSGVQGLIHPASDFMLDLLNTRLRGASLSKLNLTVARFKVADSDYEATEGVIAKPTLLAVRFEGMHLLDSIAACRLLDHDHRPLVEMALRLSYKSQEDDTEGHYPIKIALETDHVLVATGFGSVALESLQVHSLVVRAVSQEIEHGVGDQDRLQVLVEKIRKRAGESESPAAATMLVDPDADSDEAGS
jgi:hypothetical protein